MALNRQTFQTRAITAVVFAAVMLAGLLWNQWSFLVLFSIIHFGCWWEFLSLLEKIYHTSIHTYVKLGLMVMGYGVLLWFCGPLFQVNGYGLRENISLPVSAAGFTILLIGIFQKTPLHVKAFFSALMGLLYISLSWGLLMDMYQSMDLQVHDTTFVITAKSVPLLIIISIWVNDTMAYIVGSFIGKTPLSKISPKKTWEGTVGGIILSIAVVGLIAFYGFNFRWLSVHVMIVAAIAAIVGTLGDLLQSKLKRLAGVKDSGAFMPGHGGFLDRFDSLVFAIPFVWLYIELAVK